MAIETNDQLSPREYILMQAEQEESKLAREHDIRVRELELQAKHEDRQLELAIRQYEVKWQQLFRIPLIIVRWPLYVFLGLAYCIAMIRKTQPSPDFWKFLRL